MVKSTKNSFRAAILRNVNSELNIEHLVLPALKEGEAIVQVLYSGICASQVMEVQGKRGRDNWLPHLLGHEGVGIVEKVYSKVDRELLGKKVILTWLRPRNSENKNRKYTTQYGEIINSGEVSTLTEKIVVSTKSLHVVNSKFSDRVLALFGCALATGGGMAINHCPPKKEKRLRVAVLGFGGVGAGAAVALKGMGLIVNIWELSEARRALARNLGFGVIESPEELSSHMNSFDLCFEASGSVATIELALRLIHFEGKVVFASHPPTGEHIRINPHDLIRGKKIEGYWGGDGFHSGFFRELEVLVEKAKIDSEQLVGEVFDLNDINLAIATAAKQQTGRVLVKL